MSIKTYRGNYMDGSYITKEAHDEFARRMEAENKRLSDEDKRQNARIDALEENVKEIHGLTLSVERMAANMENMLAAIERQGNLIEKQSERVDKMEKEPANDYKQIKAVVITAIITLIVSFVGNAILSLL